MHCMVESHPLPANDAQAAAEALKSRAALEDEAKTYKDGLAPFKTNKKGETKEAMFAKKAAAHIGHKFCPGDIHLGTLCELIWSALPRAPLDPFTMRSSWGPREELDHLLKDHAFWKSIIRDPKSSKSVRELIDEQSARETTIQEKEEALRLLKAKHPNIDTEIEDEGRSIAQLDSECQRLRRTLQNPYADKRFLALKETLDLAKKREADLKSIRREMQQKRKDLDALVSKRLSGPQELDARQADVIQHARARQATILPRITKLESELGVGTLYEDRGGFASIEPLMRLTGSKRLPTGDPIKIAIGKHDKLFAAVCALYICTRT